LDLLSSIPTHEQKGDISLQEDRGNLIIKGLSKHIVNNEEEAFNLVFEGEANRTISEHQLNKVSTRSHCIFTIYLEMKSRIESSEKVIISKLNFVDLAGSERVKKTGSTGLTLKEANYINKSLTFLEQVVVALTDKSKKSSKLKDHIPYRQSKLTHILKDSIGGNCRTVMIATVWPEEPYLFETLSTLNFAKRMMNVMNEASVNIQLDTNALLRKYQKEIKELKQELAMHNTLSNRGRINYDTYTPEEQYQQQLIAKRFLHGQIDDIDFESVRQAKELFSQCRYLFRNYTAGREIGDNTADINKFSNQNPNANFSKKMNQLNDDGVGVLELKSSFGIGSAPKDARPISKCNKLLTFSGN
jgi:kinesin family protein 6/9